MQPFPLFMYHKTDAPEGRVFTSLEQLEAAQAASGPPGWVDTPAKFDPNYVEPTPAGVLGPVIGLRGQLYAPKLFPSLRYSRSGEECIVRTQEEADALNADEWKDSPAAFKEPLERQRVAAPVSVVPSMPDAPQEPAPPTPPTEAEQRAAEEMAAKARELAATPIEKVKEVLAGADQPTLERVKQLEMLNPDGPRVTLVKFIDAALKALAPTE